MLSEEAGSHQASSKHEQAFLLPQLLLLPWTVLLGWLPGCPRATPTTGGGGPPWPEPVWRLVAQNSAIPVPPSAYRKMYFYLHSCLYFNHRFLLVNVKVHLVK